MKYFTTSFIVTIICTILAVIWGGWSALYVILFLALLEVSLSFDNAVVNATVLKTMSKFWQTLFLTVGILIAVIGMRLILPILMVAIPTETSMIEIMDIALHHPRQYYSLVQESYIYIIGFGGVFLLMVALHFFFNHERDIFWIGLWEKKLSQLGRIKGITTIIVVAVVGIYVYFIPPSKNLYYAFVLSCGLGYFAFTIMHLLDKILSHYMSTKNNGVVTRSGLIGFLYLELLDASFSLDGVVGAFAITQDVVIIMLGLAIGAIFVRSFTIWMVEKETLTTFIYLEHGAQYAILLLGLLMLGSVIIHTPEWVVGSIGASLILISFYSSYRYKQLARHNE